MEESDVNKVSVQTGQAGQGKSKEKLTRTHRPERSPIVTSGGAAICISNVAENQRFTSVGIYNVVFMIQFRRDGTSPSRNLLPVILHSRTSDTGNKHV